MIFVAIKDISPGEELLLDYGEGYWQGIDLNTFPQDESEEDEFFSSLFLLAICNRRECPLRKFKGKKAECLNSTDNSEFGINPEA